MSTAADGPRSTPIFKRCPRCSYSLRGLPANHVCPECGLGFDEDCELYPVTNPRQVVLVWIAILSGGWAALKNLRHLEHLAATSVWEKVGVLAALAWIPFMIFAVVWLVRRYRRGFTVAVTRDGLIIRLPGFKDDLIPWNEIGGASIMERPQNKAQLASVFLAKRKRNVGVGGLHNVFPTRADVVRFVGQVNERVEAQTAGSVHQGED